MKNETTKQNNIIWILIVAIFFGFGGGVAGLIITRNYFTPQPVIITDTQQIDNSQDSLRQANLIIENAKKIIIGQENKVNETISSSQNSIIGVFKKRDEAATSSPEQLDTKVFDLNKYYSLNDQVGEGLVVTSDGWVLTTDFSKDAPEAQIVKNFVAITKTNDIYEIDKISKTGINSYIFVHLAKAKDLSVKSFVNTMDIPNNQSMVALNWQGESYLTSIINKKEKGLTILDSDLSAKKIHLANDLGSYFENAFIFNLNSQVVGYYDKKNGVTSLDNFQPLIDSLLKNKIAKRPYLGISYINLNDFAIKDIQLSTGALIYNQGKLPAVKADSPSAIAGLVAGDIILSVDNVTLDAQHDLASVIQKYSAGKDINLIYRRNGIEHTVKITLAELK